MKLKIDKIKVFLRKLPRLLGEHFLITFLLFVVMSIIFGSFMLYKYAFLAEKPITKNIEAPVKFNDSLYRKVLEEWKERQEEFKKVDSKTYNNPFEAPSSVSSSRALTE